MIAQTEKRRNFEFHVLGLSPTRIRSRSSKLAAHPKWQGYQSNNSDDNGRAENEESPRFDVAFKKSLPQQ